MFSAALSLLFALPIALAAPTCSLKTTSASPSSYPVPTNSSSTTPAPTNSSSTTSAGTGGKISMGWFADWHTEFPVADIPWKGYTHMAFFTAQPSADSTVEVIVNSDSMVDEFTAAAVKNNVKPLITLGGWAGSIYWSSSVATAQNRSTLANSVVQYCHQHGFVGIDLDWEYPGNKGIGCNIVSPDDSANFLLFMQELRQLAPNLTISAATSTKPWADSSGNPLTDVSAYAAVLDWIEIMNYDIHGTFSSATGPNSPLNDTCAPSANQAGSAVFAVDAWTKAKFPVGKIVLGVAAYGHSFTVPSSTAVTGNTLNIYTAFDKVNIPPGDSWDPKDTTPDICGNPPVGNGNSGLYNFWALIKEGFLNQDGTSASGMVSLFDECSQTPFVYNPSSSILVSYDDDKSFTLKGQYIKTAGLGGYAVFEAGGDYNGMLVNAINTGMA